MIRNALFPYFSTLCLMGAAGEGGGAGSGGTTGAPDLVDVDLHGVTVKLPKDQADKVIAGRQAAKDELRKANERAGAADAERKAAADVAAEATRTAEMEKAAKAGEIEKVKQLANEKVVKYGERLRDRTLEAAIAKLDTLAPDAGRYLLPQLRTSCRFAMDSDTLEVVGEGGAPRVGSDGKPMSVDALISEIIDAQPLLRKASGSPGSGAKGGAGAMGAVGKTMTLAEYNAACKDPARAQTVAQQIAAKTLTVV